MSAYKQQKFLSSGRLKSLRSGYQHGCRPGMGLLQAVDWCFHHILTWRKSREQNKLLVFSYKGPSPIQESSTSRPVTS